MNKTEFIDALQRIAPALCSKGPVPVLSCFCFDEETATTYDNIVALQIPLKSSIVGGIQGQTLLNFLRASNGKTLKFSHVENQVKFTVGRAQLKMEMLPPDDFVFVFPERKDIIELPINKDFVDVLSKNLISMGEDLAQPWRMGITLLFTENSLILFSSDNITAAQSIISLECPKELVGFSLVLSPRFCSLLTKLSSNDEPELFILAKEWIEIDFKSGLRLFSRTIQDVRVDKYVSLFERIESKERTVSFPEDFQNCLARALVVLDQPQNQLSTMSLDKGKLMLFSKSLIGDIQDELDYEGEHLKTTVKCSPALLKRALKFTDKFCVIPDIGIIMEGDSFLYLVAVVN